MELFTPESGLIIWMFVAFAILFLILWKFAWPSIMKGIDGRADFIDKGVEYAQNAKEQLDGARKEADEILAQARRQQADMLREADRMKSEIVEEARSAAQIEANKVMEQAKVSIAQARKEAEQSLKAEVGSIALDIATKVVKNQLQDQKAQAKLVDTLMDEMANNN
ncbi:MAG: F0F1 ATP synthase subunit B [Muribaculaceae bacterium]|nr:F0F1 ATP synthase subunit B [Muribaculaceae bacterium]